jgi:hypothetical protein
MTKKNKRQKVFLETSGVIYDQLGHSLQKQAVRDAVADGKVHVSNFIRMEYLRGVVLNLIDFYFLLKDSESVPDALIDWAQLVHQERKLKIVLMFLPSWIQGQESWQNKDTSLRRLGDLIIRMVYEFDETYTRRVKDRLRCQLGRVRFGYRSFREDILLRFYERFTAIQKSIPSCKLCEFKATQQNSLEHKKIDLFSPAQRQKFKTNAGYVKQAERLEEVASLTETAPKCRWCERLGDSIIVLHLPVKFLLITADKSFEAFGQVLNQEVKRLPSLAELKRQFESQQAETEAD